MIIIEFYSKKIVKGRNRKISFFIMIIIEFYSKVVEIRKMILQERIIFNNCLIS